MGASYAISTLLFAFALLLLGLRAAGRPAPAGPEDLLQVAASMWFAAGALVALALFVTSYLRAGSADARRRMRVALLGTFLGLGPSASLILLRNLSPADVVPGERWAIALTVFVPASFAWAVVIHRIFDFRVALRAAVGVVVLGVIGLVVYSVGEWWTAATWPERAAQVSGGALAFVALAASLAGPAAPMLRAIGARLVPDEASRSLSSWFQEPAAIAVPRDAESLLGGACGAITRALRLRGCLAIVATPGGARAIKGGPTSGLQEPGPELMLRALRIAKGDLCAVDDPRLDAADREAFELAGLSWLLPVGDAPARTVLLLGRRLAGAWLSRHEVLELERFVAHLAIALENAALRREASSHGALERELKAAGAVQAHLLPQRVPVHPTLDCAAAVLSCEPVGGDYYDFVEGPEREFTLAVGDAAGKGMPAALLLAHVQARFRSEARRDITPGTLLGALNRDLVGLDQPEKFVGLICARVDVRNARVWVANGGMMPLLVRRRDGSVEEIESGGMLLGVSESASYPDVCVDLDAGEVLLVYTDGLPEAPRGGEMFGVERVKTILSRMGPRRAADILQELLSEVRAFVDGPLDDLTVVVLKQLTLSPRAQRPAEIPLKKVWAPADPAV
jgi:serine phosphatase RsbU (regulator of sigma subunit)